MDSNTASEHGDSVDEAPAGWEGGELIHTGGGLYAREWVHPEKELRVGYSVDEPTLVGVEVVHFEGEGEETKPLEWQRVDDVDSEPCGGEEDCLETALDLMQQINDEK